MPDSTVVFRADAAASSAGSAFRRRCPMGAEPMGDGRTHVRLWAPLADRVECVVSARGEERTTALTRERDGYFGGVIDGEAGDRYRFRLDGGVQLYPDPASR